MNKTINRTDATTVAVIAARAADEKQGTNILVLNVGDILAITEMFVVVSASNSRQLPSGVFQALKTTSTPPARSRASSSS